MRRIYKGLVAAGLGLAVAGAVLAQTGAPVNPPSGSVWTYFGPTFGASWAPPSNVTGCTSIIAYGGVGDDVTDNTPAWNAAKAAGVKCLMFPEGTYRFNSTISYTFGADTTTGFTVLGAGQDVSILHWPNSVTTAMEINTNGYAQSIHVRDLSFTTGSSKLDTGLKVTPTKVSDSVAYQSGYTPSDVTRVTFRAQDGAFGSNPSAHNWSRAIWINGGSVFDFVGVAIYGALPAGNTSGYVGSGDAIGDGIVIEPNLAGGNLSTPVVYNFDRVNINWVKNAILIGSRVQGLQITTSNFVGCLAGVAYSSGPDNVQMTVGNSQFNCTYGINVTPIAQMIMASNNLFYVPPTGIGIAMSGSSHLTQITGNGFAGTADPNVGIGIQLAPAGDDIIPATITGNTFWRLTTGVSLNSHVVGALVGQNVFRTNGTNIVNAAANSYNQITGPVSSTFTPSYKTVTGAANNGSGLVRLTVASTSDLVNGQMVLVGAVGGLTRLAVEWVAAPIAVIDATHVDLLTILFAGSYTSGGSFTTLP